MNDKDKIDAREHSDDYTEKIVRKVHEQITIPDMEASWQKMQVRLEKHRRKRQMFKTLRLGIAIAGLSIIIGLSFSNTNPTSAFSSLYNLVKTAQEGVVHIFFGSAEEQDISGAKTSPPPDFIAESNPPKNESPSYIGDSIKPEMTTIEEAQKKLSFSLLLPEHIPDPFYLNKTQLYKDPDGIYRNIHLEYITSSGEIFNLTEKKLEPNSSGLTTSIHEDSGKIKETNMHGNSGILVLYTNGGSRIEWIFNDVKITVFGELTEEEIIKFAQSLK